MLLSRTAEWKINDNLIKTTDMMSTSPTIAIAFKKNRRLQKLPTALIPVCLVILCMLLTSLHTAAQIAVRGSLTKGTKPVTGTTALTIAKPTGVVAGDVLFAEISQREVTFGVTLPAGWTSIDAANIYYNSYSGVSVKYGGLLCYKVASDSEPAEYTFDLSPNSLAIGCIIAFSGVDVSGATPFDVTPRGFYVSESGTGSVIRDGTLSSQALGITTVTNNAAVIMFTITGNIPTFSGWTTATAGALTELMDQNLMASDGRYVAAVGAAWRIKSTAGATGTGRVDLSKEATNASMLVALRRRPPAPTISSFTPTTGCVGSSIRINGSNFTLINTVKFNGVDASFTVNSSSQITAIVPSGATTGKITVSNGGGTATSATNFTPPVFATISGNQDVCVGNSTNFTASVAGGNWTTSDATIATVSPAGLINGLKAGIATITYTLVSGGCTTPSSRGVMVTAPPQAGTLSGEQNICVGSTTSFSSNAAGGSWSSSDAAIAKVDAVSGVVTGVSAGTANITYTVKGTGGCGDASVDRTVIVNEPSSTITIITSCDSYTWPVDGQTYAASGTYTSVKGCATEILELTITGSTSHTSVISACDSYTWPEDGQNYTASGTYTSVKGCATEILELTITGSTSHTSVISACDSYTWPEDGQTYTTSGTYTSVKGCVTEILELSITGSTSHTAVISACDSYTWPEDGQTYTTSGTYTSVKGCATEILELTITGSTSHTSVISACDSYTWPEDRQTYTTSGTYTSVKGCVTEILELSITGSTSHTAVISACDSYTWPEDGQTYTTSGTYTSVKGCATEILELTITGSTSHTSVISACDSYTWPEDGQTYTTSGTYTSVKGCATEILELTIAGSTSHTAVISACDSYTWPEDGQTYTTSGTYTSVKGCATEILELTITGSTSHTSVIIACDSYTWPEDGQTYTTSGTYTSLKGCATEILELSITAAPIWYLDADADGYYTGNAITQCESPGMGYRTTGIIGAGDCDDDNPAINPGAKEICGNGIDDNCTGQVDENCTVCGDITSQTTTDIKSTIVTFNWVAAIDPDEWLVQYKTNAPGSKWIDVLLSGSARSIAISNLQTKQNYMWHIKARCGKSWTKYSSSILFTTLAGPTIASSITINNNNSADRSVKTVPNPAHDFAMLHVSGFTGEITIQVMSSEGKLIQQQKIMAARDHTAIYQLTVSSYAAGMYLVMVADTKGNKKMEKLLIVR